MSDAVLRPGLRIVHISNLARREDDRLAVLKNYALFYNELAHDGVDVRLFAPVIGSSDAGYGFLDEVELDRRIEVATVPGHTPESSVGRFVLDNLRAAFRVAAYCTPRDHYFVFLPSYPGLVALFCLLAMRRYRTLGLYIGGDFAREQQFEQRSSLLKRLAKRLGAPLMTRVIDRGIRTADYVLSACHRHHHDHKATSHIMLAPVLMNVDADDLQAPVPELRHDQLPIAFCGELRPAKGVMVLLEGFRLLRRRRPDLPFVLHFIGSGHAEPMMREWVRRSELEPHVEFLGQLKDRDVLHRELRQCFALVLPSYSEGFPRVAYECFTLGVPTLLTPVGGIPFLLQDGAQSLFIRVGQPEDIVVQLLRLHADGALRGRIIAGGRRLMRDHVFPSLARHGSLADMVQQGMRGVLFPD